MSNITYKRALVNALIGTRCQQACSTAGLGLSFQHHLGNSLVFSGWNTSLLNPVFLCFHPHYFLEHSSFLKRGVWEENFQELGYLKMSLLYTYPSVNSFSLLLRTQLLSKTLLNEKNFPLILRGKTMMHSFTIQKYTNDFHRKITC